MSAPVAGGAGGAAVTVTVLALPSRGSESTGKTDESLRSNVPEKRPRVGKAGMRELRAGAWLILGGQGGLSGRGPLQLGYEEAVSFSG